LLDVFGGLQKLLVALGDIPFPDVSTKGYQVLFQDVTDLRFSRVKWWMRATKRLARHPNHDPPREHEAKEEDH
jgi:hypothetical protein